MGVDSAKFTEEMLRRLKIREGAGFDPQSKSIQTRIANAVREIRGRKDYKAILVNKLSATEAEKEGVIEETTDEFVRLILLAILGDTILPKALAQRSGEINGYKTDSDDGGGASEEVAEESAFALPKGVRVDRANVLAQEEVSEEMPRVELVVEAGAAPEVRTGERSTDQALWPKVVRRSLAMLIERMSGDAELNAYLNELLSFASRIS